MIKYVLKRLISNFLSCIFYMIGMLVFMTYIYIVFMNETKFNITTTSIMQMWIVCIIGWIISIIIYELIFYLKNKSFKFEIDYLRELPRNYSPSMASFLLNLSFECRKDALADLLYLEQRNIIKIENDNIIILEPNFKWNNDEKHLEFLMHVVAFSKNSVNGTLSMLSNNGGLYFKESGCASYLDKKFARNDITNNRLANDYRKTIISDLKKDKLITNNKVFLILCLISMLLGLINPFIYMYLLMITIFVNNANYQRTKQGRIDAALWFSYYKFIKDFSIMNERNLEEKKLWGYYFAYGLALGINTKVIKKFDLGYERYIIK